MTLTREGEFVGSEDDNVEEINIFDGQDNRITFEQVATKWQPTFVFFERQVYTKTFKCTYQLQLYPFDTQVRHYYQINNDDNTDARIVQGVHSQPDRAKA